MDPADPFGPPNETLNDAVRHAVRLAAVVEVDAADVEEVELPVVVVVVWGGLVVDVEELDPPHAASPRATAPRATSADVRRRCVPRLLLDSADRRSSRLVVT